jgi:sialate O-acetylesterase
MSKWLPGAMLSFGAMLAAPSSNAALLHDLFQDHVVLQRDQAVNVWGRATPGESLTVTLASSSVQAKADSTGLWRSNLSSMSAGGPYQLSVTAASGEKQVVDDVMIGDVWLCSGQSNMVLQVHRALDSRSEILNSTNDSIRMLTVPLAANPAPQYGFDAEERQGADGIDQLGVGRLEDPVMDDGARASFHGWL